MSVQAIFQWSKWPLVIFAQNRDQNSCTTLKCRDGFGRITTFKEFGMNKELFLKNLSTLFNELQGNFTIENTNVVDDSPTKHITNKPKNVCGFSKYLDE